MLSLFSLNALIFYACIFNLIITYKSYFVYSVPANICNIVSVFRLYKVSEPLGLANNY